LNRKSEAVVADVWSCTGIEAVSGFAVNKEARALVALGYLTFPLCSDSCVARVGDIGEQSVAAL
jgi:hypothetical protein